MLIKPSLYIKATDIPDASDTILLMMAGERHFNYGLLNRMTKELVEFGFYIPENMPDVDWGEFFEQNNIFSQNYFLSALAFSVTESVFIPAGVYRSAEVQLHLDAVFGTKVQSVIVTELLPEWSIYHVYRVPAGLHAAVSRRFDTEKFRNAYSVLMNTCSGEKKEAMLVNFKTDEFSVIVFIHNKFQLAQTFTYASPEDVMYYLLKICRQFQLSQQSVKISLAGLIEKDSAVYRELYKYFMHLQFDELPEGIRIADALHEYPHHYYSSICKLAACVL